MNKSPKIGTLVARVMMVLAMSMGLSACDQLRSKLANFIAPQSHQDLLKSVNGLIDAGQYTDARDKAAPYTEKQDAVLRGEFAFSAARASAYLGDTDAAIRFLIIAVNTLQLNPDVPMADPAFQDLRTDLRFVQAITDSSPSRKDAGQPRQAEKSPDVEVNAGGNAQIRMDQKGTEVRAGDVSIRIEN